MNRDDVLARSRAENQGNDEYERMVLEKAGRLSAQVGMLACCAIAVASVAVTGRVNYGCWVIYFAIHASLFWVKYCHLRRRHEGMMAVVSTLTGLLFAVLFVLELAGWRHG